MKRHACGHGQLFECIETATGLKNGTLLQNPVDGNAVAIECFKREVDSPLAGILADIPQDVGQLQSMTEVHRIGFAGGIGAAKNPNRDKSHSTGNAPTIFLKL